MVNNAVKESGGDFGVGKDVIPAGKFKVGSDNDRFAFVTFGNNAEKEFGAVGINGNIAPFITDEQIHFIELLHKI